MPALPVLIPTVRPESPQNKKDAPGKRERPSLAKLWDRLLLARLVRRGDLLARLLQNALHLSNVGAGRGQV